MEIQHALDQISEIHEHLARGEVSRDWRAGPIAASGVLAIAAAAVQPHLLAPPYADARFVTYWVAMAVLGIALGGGAIVRQYLREPSPYARRRTRTVVGQFLPCVGGGMLVTGALGLREPAMVALLPGLWALLFSLGVFASRPYLPRMIGWVALFYLAAGGALLALAGSGASLSPWAMGATFGLGQLASGFVLYWNLERNGHERQKQ